MRYKYTNVIPTGDLPKVRHANDTNSTNKNIEEVRLPKIKTGLATFGKSDFPRISIIRIISTISILVLIRY